MAIYRGNLVVDRFTMIPNAWLRDPRLTMADKGLLAYIASHNPSYPLTVQQVIAEHDNGKAAIGAVMKRLEKVGYLRRERRRGEDGRIGGYDWHLVDVSAGHDQGPLSGAGPDQERRDVSPGHDQGRETGAGLSVVENPATKKTTSKNTTEENQEHLKGVRASSSSPPPQRKPKNEDEDARTPKTKKPRANRGETADQKAVEDIAARLDTDLEQAEATLDYLRELAAERGDRIGQPDRYVRKLSDDDLAWWHEEAQYDALPRRRQVNDLLAHLDKNQPNVSPQRRGEFARAAADVFRDRYSWDEVAAALNATHSGGQGDLLQRYLTALAGLSGSVAA